jgi:hypothetical protein
MMRVLPSREEVGELHPAAANDIHAPWRLTFHEQNRALGITASVRDSFQFLERFLGEVTEETSITKLADQAALAELQAVR